jgi:AbrB family looped-hinge helix DNA binding protein
MVSHTTTLTRNGQVAIPIEIRRALDLNAGDQVEVEQQGEVILVRRARSVAERTGGILVGYRLATPLPAEDERAAFEQAVADEVAGTGRA